MKYEYDAFISYSSQDNEKARMLANTLTHLGLEVFLSESNLERKIGESFLSEIGKALEKSKHLVLIASKSSLSSPWVQLEYSNFINVCYAKNPKKRKVIILKIAELNVEQIPFLLRSFQITEKSNLVANFLFDNKAKKIKRESLVKPPEINELLRKINIDIQDEEFVYLGNSEVFDKEFIKKLSKPKSTSKAKQVQNFIKEKFSVNHKRRHLSGDEYSFVILLVRGESPDGKKLFAYVSVKVEKLEEFMEAQKSKIFYPEDHGEIIVSGEGIPSRKIRREMEQKYGYDHGNEIFL